MNLRDRVRLKRMPPERDDENVGWYIGGFMPNGDLDLYHPMGGSTYARPEEVTPDPGEQ